MTDQRLDLVRGMLQSAYIIECARAAVQGSWGFDEAVRTQQRADRVAAFLDGMDLPRRDDVVPAHTAWLESYVGSSPDEVPLGAAVLHFLGRWPDVLATPFLGVEADEFLALGREHTRIEAERRPMTDDELSLPRTDLPDGRRFVILTDVHVGSRGRDALARTAVDEINAIAPEFVVIPGDFTEDGEPEQFRAAKQIFDRLSCPYHVVMGNHDAVQRSTGQGVGSKFYAETFGMEAGDHVIDCGDLQVALVDTSDPTKYPYADPDASQVVGGVDSGALRPGQAAALAARLDKTRPVLVVQHHELQPFPGFPPVKFGLRDEDSAEELDALKDHNVIGVIAGHTHRSALLDVGVPQLEIPSLKDWPHAYSVAGVSDDGVRVVARQLGDADAVRSMSRSVLSVMRRFHMGDPWARLDYSFTF